MSTLAWLPASAMLIALVIDRLFGEPPVWAHPVVGMGRFLGLFGDRLCALRPRAALIGGALVWLLGAGAVVGLAIGAELLIWMWIEPWRLGFRLLVAAGLIGLLLKPLLAWRMLRDEVLAVEAALARSLDEGRTQLARLVSRDTRALSEPEVRETAIETLAENLNDSVIAPLFWFMVAGLPGAALYRFANTADAMWGYRGRWEWAGKWAARADDVLSWLPARLTGLVLMGPDVRQLAALHRESLRTPSPNGGWPMGAMALRLGRRLTKPGHYVLNADGAAVRAGDVAQACRFASQAMWALAVLLALFAAVMRGA